MVAQVILVHFVLVRIQVRQPSSPPSLNSCSFLTVNKVQTLAFVLLGLLFQSVIKPCFPGIISPKD